MTKNNYKIVLNKTLEEYNKKYRNRKHRLLKYSKKQLEDFDKQYGHYTYNGKTHSLEFDNYLLKNRKWWLIDNVYYEIPKAPTLVWFRNLSGVTQILIGVGGLAIASTAVALPIVLTNNPEKKVEEPKIIVDTDKIETPIFEIENDNYVAILKSKDPDKAVKITDIKIGDTVLTKGVHYTYDENTQKLTIIKNEVKNMKGDIHIITSTVIIPKYQVNWSNKVTFSNGNQTLENSCYELAAGDGASQIQGSVKIVVGKGDEYSSVIDASSGTYYKANVGETEDDKITAYYKKDSGTPDPDGELYLLTDKGNIGKICFADNDVGLGQVGSVFICCGNAKDIILSNIDTSYMTSMYDMFFGCKSIKNLDLSKFNTSNVTNMLEMFSGCTNLKEINLLSFNTAKVECMSSMFVNCDAIEVLDLSSFDTSNVNAMAGMFESNEVAPSTSTLQKIIVDGNKFKTDKVTGEEGQGLFSGCNLLTGEAGSTLASVQTLDPTNYLNVAHAIVDTDSTKSTTAGYFTQKK